MTTVSIHDSSWPVIRADPDYHEIIREYASESSITGMPAFNPDEKLYAQLETLGILHAFTARLGPFLVGFIGLLVTPNPHYGCLIGTIESYFVQAQHRKTGAGLELLVTARKKAVELGAKGFMISAPHGSSLGRVLERRSFTHTNDVYFQSLS
jgi:hypothetical protein